MRLLSLPSDRGPGIPQRRLDLGVELPEELADLLVDLPVGLLVDLLVDLGVELVDLLVELADLLVGQPVEQEQAWIAQTRQRPGRT